MAELALARRIASKAQHEVAHLEAEVALSRERRQQDQWQRTVESKAASFRLATRSPGSTSFGGSPSQADTSLLHALASQGRLLPAPARSVPSPNEAEMLSHLSSAIESTSQDPSNESFRSVNADPVHLRQAQRTHATRSSTTMDGAASIMYASPEMTHIQRKLLGTSGSAETGRSLQPKQASRNSARAAKKSTNWGWGGVGKGGYGSAQNVARER